MALILWVYILFTYRVEHASLYRIGVVYVLQPLRIVRENFNEFNVLEHIPTQHICTSIIPPIYNYSQPCVLRGGCVFSEYMVYPMRML